MIVRTVYIHDDKHGTFGEWEDYGLPSIPMPGAMIGTDLLIGPPEIVISVPNNSHVFEWLIRQAMLYFSYETFTTRPLEVRWRGYIIRSYVRQADECELRVALVGAPETRWKLPEAAWQKV